MNWLQFTVGFVAVPVMFAVMMGLIYVSGVSVGSTQSVYLGLFTFMGLFVLMAVLLTALGLI